MKLLLTPQYNIAVLVKRFCHLLALFSVHRLWLGAKSCKFAFTLLAYLLTGRLLLLHLTKIAEVCDATIVEVCFAAGYVNIYSHQTYCTYKIKFLNGVHTREQG